MIKTSSDNIFYCLQRKEPVGDSDELPENVVSGLEELTPEILQVNCLSQYFPDIWFFVL